MNKNTIHKLLIMQLVSMLLSVCLFCSIYADENNDDELLMFSSEESELENIELLSKESILSGVNTNKLPDKIDLSQTKYFPPIANQIGNSCSSYATTYYQFTYEVARLNNWDAKNDTSNIYSPKFTFNFINKGYQTGMFSCADNYRYLKDLGAVKMEEFHSETEEMDWYQGNSYDETVNTLRNALNYRLESYYNIKFYDYENEVDGIPVITGYNDTDLNVIKSLLNDGHVLVISTKANAFEYRYLDNGEEICIYKNSKDNDHAMTIVGYDDNIWYDLNGDGLKQDYELGALKLANSWGTGQHNNGFTWILYDALNQTSNVSDYNTETRGRLIAGNMVTYINVARYEPEITAEVTLSFCNRSELAIYTSRKKYVGISCSADYNFFSGYGNAINASGGTEYETYTLVVDFTGANEQYVKKIKENSINEEFDTNNYFYCIEIRDKTPTNDQKITIENIRWVDSNGNIIKEESDVGEIGTNGKIKVNNLIEINGIEMENTTSELYSYENLQLQPTITPANATKKDLIWVSSNTDVATVDNEGNLTYVGIGETTITATTTDGSNLSASCTITTYDDYADTRERGKQIIVDSTIYGEIETTYDVDYFKFVAPKTGNYIFNSEGYTDTVGYVYNSNNSLIGYNDDYSEEGSYNFEVSCELNEGETYYIKVIASDGDVGEYGLVVREAN